MESNVTTNKDFQLFKAECKKWIEILGLKGWEIIYKHEDNKIKGRANFHIQLIDRISVITLSKTWGDNIVSKNSIRRSAFHEICEVFLSRIKIIAESRFINSDEIDEEIHAIIRTLENVIFNLSHE